MIDKNQFYLGFSLYGMAINQAIATFIKLIDVNELKALIVVLIAETIILIIYLTKKSYGISKN
jgi:hypothetical protein